MRKSSELHASEAKSHSSITGASGSSSNEKNTGMKQKGTGDLIARHKASDFISKSVAMSHSYVHGSCVVRLLERIVH